MSEFYEIYAEKNGNELETIVKRRTKTADEAAKSLVEKYKNDLAVKVFANCYSDDSGAYYNPATGADFQRQIDWADWYR